MNQQQPAAKREQPSTYFVQDRSNEEELMRLRRQDEMLTTSMGGVLPEQPDPASFRRVLDVGCGTGGWLIETAKTYPAIEMLAGFDVSSHMIAYAREQAEAAQVADRVTFSVGDALRRIEFPANAFDLVNQRLGMSYLRVWDWSKLLQEYQRVARPGGVIRITEASSITENSSPALTQISTLAHKAYTNAGYLFSTAPESIITMLAKLMTQHGIHRLVYHGGTPQGQRFAEDMAALFRVGLPFLHKWTRVPDDYDALRQHAIQEMQQPDFVATWTFLTAWGNNKHEYYK